jgi:hypothetical protein
MTEIRKVLRSGLFAAGLVAAGVIGYSAPSSAAAIGPNSPFYFGYYHLNMGPLGKWKVNGGVTAFGGWRTNDAGTGTTVGTMSFDNAELRLKGAKGPFSWDVWVGMAPNTPVLGYTSRLLGPNLEPFCASGGPSASSAGTNCSGPNLFKGFVTWQATPWLSFDAGRLSSPDGTEIGVDWYNPTIWLSDLNNMQTTTADGVQVDFTNPSNSGSFFIPHYGSVLSIMLRNGYHSWGHMSELGFAGVWNFNAAATQELFAFGHTRLGHVLLPSGHPGFCMGAFASCNANLIGFGGFITVGNWLFDPEIENQWLPKGDNLAIGGPGSSTSTYGHWDGQLTATYSFSPQWTLSGQVMYVHQYGNQNAPNAEALGDFLGLQAGPGVGTFGPGSNMLAFQIDPAYQFRNFFIRPGIEYTRLSHFIPGDGYGLNGNGANQFVGLVEVGFLLGPTPKSVAKWGF